MITDIVSFTAEGPEHDHRRKSREKRSSLNLSKYSIWQIDYGKSMGFRSGLLSLLLLNY